MVQLTAPPPLLLAPACRVCRAWRCSFSLLVSLVSADSELTMPSISCALRASASLRNADSSTCVGEPASAPRLWKYASAASVGFSVGRTHAPCCTRYESEVKPASGVYGRAPTTNGVTPSAVAIVLSIESTATPFVVPSTKPVRVARIAAWFSAPLFMDTPRMTFKYFLYGSNGDKTPRPLAVRLMSAPIPAGSKCSTGMP